MLRIAAWGLHLLVACTLASETSPGLSAARDDRGIEAVVDSVGFLADMRRSNEAESDHRRIMTPEFRQFCITAREHTLCCMAYMFLFVCSYVAARRACLRVPSGSETDTGSLKGDESEEPARSKRRKSARYLVAPYSRAFRARQISLLICSAGLTSAGMTGVLVAATVALANAMEHGDPQALGSWRTWLLPSTLLNPGDGHGAVAVGGAHVAHDFPPVLRRLWVYQSVVSVATAAFLVPVGILFERTSRRAAAVPRLGVALLRWMLLTALVVVAWELASQRSEYLRALGFYRVLSHSGATVRHSVYRAASIFGALPAVLVVVPRGTWALFSWLQSSVGQKHAIAHIARTRYVQLKTEQQRIEARLQRAIGSWKWERIQGADDAWVIDSCSDDDDREAVQKPDSIESVRSSSTVTAARLPPAHPGLAHSASVTGFRQLARVSSIRGPRRRLRPLAEPSASSSSLISYLSDELCSSDDGHVDISIGRAARAAQARRQRERESEMQRLSRQIKKYHAQILFVREELSRINWSDLGDLSERAVERKTGSRRVLVALARGASSVLVLVGASLCWLLVVLQVGRGALSAIFVGEPDLTHGSSHFVPVQVAVSPLVSACQVVAAMSLFVVVMFGVVSVGPMDPMQLLGTPWLGVLVLPRARQWRWMPQALLGNGVLAAVDPRAGMARLSEAAAGAGPVSGNTARVFFSSSADLTSYYRELQRQPLAALLPTAPTALQGGGTLPESLFLARGWGRRVFLLWRTRGARPVSTQRLLAYAWLVCGLALTWPSVLRTAGLISERAYVLPVVALVQPLWPPLEHAAIEDTDQQPLLVLQPDAMNPALLSSVLWTQAANNNVCPAPSVFVPNFSFDLGTDTCDTGAASSCWHNSTTSNVPEALGDSSGVDLGTNNSSALGVAGQRVSRRLLLDSLAAETLPRILVRWGVTGTAHLSPHASVMLSYAVWWAYPDWIVPVSATAIDLQLGYAPPALLPVSELLLSFGASSAHSEWYGMLRRLERHRSWLPQADDGTPLVLRQMVSPQQPKLNAQGPPVPLPVLGRWSMLSSTIWDFLCALARHLSSVCVDTLQRLLALVQLGAHSTCRTVGQWAEGTAAEATLLAGARRVSNIAHGCMNVVRPLWQHVSLVPVWINDSLNFAVLLARSAGSGKARASVPLFRAAGSLASLGVATTAPSVLLPEYWAAVIAREGPALQRLRPQLWPHVYAGQHNSSLGSYIIDIAPQRQPQPTLAHKSTVNSSPSASTNAVLQASPVAPTSELVESGHSVISPAPRVAHEARQAWTALDWLLAAYRVVLGLLACRAVFGPSRSTSIFLI
ncbi:hypothetical protein IWW39_001809 [Coemansia spiralis]|uniref:Uncharacterized protein n=1 Tax=Coemansia spiralis TaxID=417178 RepID=A0A9W8GI53_9FUNG|nr:hypothetical protein IWW39_001809 [Coemansia spiralis]